MATVEALAFAAFSKHVYKRQLSVTVKYSIGSKMQIDVLDNKPSTSYAHAYTHSRGNRQRATKAARERRAYLRTQPRLFVVWDGEGMLVHRRGCECEPSNDHVDRRCRHEYTYLCAHDGEDFPDIGAPRGLRTEEIFEHLLDVAEAHPEAVHVLFGGSYDFNMILRDVTPGKLHQLSLDNTTRWHDYQITYTPRKCISIKKGRRHITLWDTIGFFQGSFLSAITSWDLNLQQSELDIIKRGKQSRGTFVIEDTELVNAYCREELRVFLRLIKALNAALIECGLYLTRWDGAGSLASVMMKLEHVKNAKRDPESWRSDYFTAVRHAYAGGRIENPQPGDHRGPIYHYDINSAHPSGTVLLPDMAKSEYIYCDEKTCQYGEYDLLHIEYNGESSAILHPFHHRQYDGSISYPAHVDNWIWGVEYTVLTKPYRKITKVKEHYHYHSIDGIVHKPFAFVHRMYNERRELKAQGLSQEKVLKLGINSIYGKTAQQKGWRPGRNIPAYFQLEWAGWITAHTRALIWQAIQEHIDDIIAIETDGIYSKVPLDLPISDRMGEWDYEVLERLTYVQSGVYFVERQSHKVNSLLGTCSFCGEVIAEEMQHSVCVSNRYRGMNRGSLTRDGLLRAWSKYSKGGPHSVRLPSTRFVTLGLALQTDFRNWRQWITDKRELALTPVGKRYHPPTCPCNMQWGEGIAHRTLPISPDAKAFPFAVKWCSMEDQLRHELLEKQLEDEREDVDSWE